MNIKLCMITLIIISISTFAIVLSAEISTSPYERHRPLVGGIQIETGRWIQYIWERLAFSTLGYAAKNIITGERGIVIAGHAVYNRSTRTQYSWVYQPKYDPSAANEYFVGIASDWNEIGDTAFVPESNVYCAILIPYKGYYEVRLYRLFDRVEVGERVCSAGIATLVQCGRIKEKLEVLVNETKEGTIVLTYVFIIEPPERFQGDSGAPYFLEFSYKEFGWIVLIGHHYGSLVSCVEGPSGEVCVPVYDMAMSLTNDLEYLNVVPLVYINAVCK